jgi:hypothetical protein
MKRLNVFILTMVVSLASVAVAYSAKAQCFDRCDRLKDKQEILDCYGRCEKIYAAELPKPMGPPDPYDECVFQCGRIAVLDQSSADQHDACCRSCEAKFRQEQATARKHEQARKNRARFCNELVHRIIQAEAYTIPSVRRGLLDEIEMAGLPPVMIDMINQYFATGSNVQLVRIKELCDQGY